MGSHVTVIEESGQIASREDQDVAEPLQDLLRMEGIDFQLSSKVTRVEFLNSRLTLTIEGTEGPFELEVSHVFVATGCQANTDDLGLETIGVEVSDAGIVAVNERLATNVKGIWAVGDIRGGPMFTHTSWDDYRVLMSQLTGDGSHTTDRIVPYAIFSDPELGRVRMTEREAHKTDKDIKVARYETKKNGKAREQRDTLGFVKLIVETDTKQILGAAVLAVEGAELIHMYVDLMNAGVPYTVIKDAVHIHPTMAEALQSVMLKI
jgi:pyruvate/2-oxoglutarate dehydrogenase complex dihydrolipoamide dehydrogenase (E3) component